MLTARSVLHARALQSLIDWLPADGSWQNGPGRPTKRLQQLIDQRFVVARPVSRTFLGPARWKYKLTAAGQARHS